MTFPPGQPSAHGPVTAINIFDLPAGQVAEFTTLWRPRAQIMAAAPGFRDTTLHRALSPKARFQLVNFAHWDSQAALEAAQASVQERVRGLRENTQLRFLAYPALYEIAAVLGKP
jgi:heme-degrading monooxygenase HmoA